MLYDDVGEDKVDAAVMPCVVRERIRKMAKPLCCCSGYDKADMMVEQV